MSTAAAPALAPDATAPVPSTKTAYTLTRGGWYLLEGLFQANDPFTTPARVVAAAKFWNKLQTLNEAVAPDKTRFDKRIVRDKSTTDLEFATLAERREEEFKAWAAEKLTIELSKKQAKLCDDAIEWGLKNRDKGVLPQSSKHLLGLLTAFGVGQNDEGKTTDE